MLVPPVGHVVHVWQTQTERLWHFNRVEIPHPPRSHFPDYTGCISFTINGLGFCPTWIYMERLLKCGRKRELFFPTGLIPSCAVNRHTGVMSTQMYHHIVSGAASISHTCHTVLAHICAFIYHLFPIIVIGYSKSIIPQYSRENYVCTSLTAFSLDHLPFPKLLR